MNAGSVLAANGTVETSAALGAVLLAGVGLFFTWVEIGNARRREVLDLLSSAYTGEVATARADVGRAFEPAIWAVVPKGEYPQPIEEPNPGNLVQKLNPASSTLLEGTKGAHTETLNSLYKVLWFFNQVYALRESITCCCGSKFRFGCGAAGQLLDDSVAPIVRTYLRYYGPKYPEGGDVSNNIGWAEITAGNGHEGLQGLAESIPAVNQCMWYDTRQKRIVDEVYHVAARPDARCFIGRGRRSVRGRR